MIAEARLQPSVSPPVVHAKALMLGSGIDIRAELESSGAPITSLTRKAGANGSLVLFPFGVIVAFNLTETEEALTIAEIRPSVRDPIASPEAETYQITLDRSEPEHVGAGRIVLRDDSKERLQIVAHALAKSVVLGYYERTAASVMAHVERLAAQLRAGKSTARMTEILQEIGDVLLIQAKTIGRAEVGEKPDLTWDYPELDALYGRLASELELRERDIALTRKLDLVSTTATLYLDILQTRKGIRVEWYIVILIIVEIILLHYELFFAR